MSEQNREFPVLPLRDVVVYPHMVIPLFVGRQKSIAALEHAMETGKQILLVAQKNAANNEPLLDDIYSIGTISNILQLLKLPDGTIKVLVEGTKRAKVEKFSAGTKFYLSEISYLKNDPLPESENQSLSRTLMSQFDRYVKLNKKVPQK